jgi:hypothetical protein
VFATLWALPLRAKMSDRPDYGRTDTSAAFPGSHEDFLRTVHDDAGLQQHCRRFGGSQNHQLVVKVHTRFAINELPEVAAAHGIGRHAGQHSCGGRLSRQDHYHVPDHTVVGLVLYCHQVVLLVELKGNEIRH